MRSPMFIALATTLILAGCSGGDDGAPTADQAAMPDDAVHQGADQPNPHAGGMPAMPAMNTEIRLADEIRAAWGAVTIRVENLETGEASEHLIPIGEARALGDTGLMVEPQVFVPGFVMDEGGITSRGPEPTNPAAHVRIVEEGSEPFEGWLFGAMPDIHPYPHDTYKVTLVEGVPAA